MIFSIKTSYVWYTLESLTEEQERRERDIEFVTLVINWREDMKWNWSKWTWNENGRMEQMCSSLSYVWPPFQDKASDPGDFEISAYLYPEHNQCIFHVVGCDLVQCAVTFQLWNDVA